MKWERIEPWNYIVTNVAAEYHKRFKMVELEDIKQSLYEWFLEHPRKLTEWEALGKKDAKNLIYRSLRNHALDYCQRWKAKTLGYDVTDLFYYNKEVVESLLPAVIRQELTNPPKLNLGMPGKPPAPHEGGNTMAMMAELSLAYFKLSDEDKLVLNLTYADGLDFPDVAKEMNLASGDAARMRNNRALNKLINRIGGFKPFIDSDATSTPNEIVEPEKESDNEGTEQDSD